MGMLAACGPQDDVLTTDPGARLGYSTDTLRFDTVFTDVRTATRRLLIRNPNDRALNIDVVELGEKAGPFRIIVNGQPGPVVRDLRLRGGDSLLVLVEATLDVSRSDRPLVVEDELLVVSNGRSDRVVLEAWGQDGVYLQDSLGCSGGDLVWTDDKPYVLSGLVNLLPGCTLRVEPGTEVYMRAGAVLLVQGTLEILGTPEALVTFTGTRDFTGAADKVRYENQPNQWEGIVFVNGSTGNRIDFADIRNGNRGVQVGIPGLEGDVDLIISNTLVANMATNTLWAFNPTFLTAYNNLFLNGGERNVAGLQGGTYTFIHNTMAYTNTLGFVRQEPSVVFTDFFEDQAAQVVYQSPFDLLMVSNVVSGSNDNELQMAFSLENPRAAIVRNVVTLRDTSLVPFLGWTTENRTQPRAFDFNAPADFDFRIDSLNSAQSPALGWGLPAAGGVFRPDAGRHQVSDVDLATDFLAEPRDLTQPDAGAIEVSP
ncbi:MAG: hypothetical protein WBA12_05610 [Catalinimonas sp.]